jgi:hypothetical protein
VKSPLVIPLALAALSVPVPAAANDSTFGGRGSDLTPLTETRVRMVSERIELVMSEDSNPGPGVEHYPWRALAWRVRATYRFHNQSDEEVALQIGFPETPCTEEMGDCNGMTGEFRRMRTTVRGEPVEHRIGRVAGRVLLPRAESWERGQLGRVFLYDVTFQPDEELEVVHRYVHDRSPNVMGESLTYLTRTGANWSGPIGEARFVVRVPYVPREVLAHPDYPGERFLVRRDGRPVGIELRFRVTDFVPRHDFDVQLAGDAGHTVGVAPPFLDGIDCPTGDAPNPTGLPAATVRVCAAVVEAAYGGPLTDETRAALSRSGLLQDYGEGAYVRVLPHPHADYDPSWMAEGDRRYVAALRGEPVEELDPTPPSPEPAPSTEPEPAAESPEPSTSPSPAAPPSTSSGCGACSAPGRSPGPPSLLWLVSLLAAYRGRRRTKT